MCSCPSEGEENAALYNMACAYSQLKETQSAVTCIQGALENGAGCVYGQCALIRCAE
jgi:hypothetical protein